MGLTQEQIRKLLKDDKAPATPFPRTQQNGPLKRYDHEMRCTHKYRGRLCNSPTYIKVEFFPRCSTHALDDLNELVIKMTDKYKEAITRTTQSS